MQFCCSFSARPSWPLSTPLFAGHARREPVSLLQVLDASPADTRHSKQLARESERPGSRSTAVPRNPILMYLTWRMRAVTRAEQLRRWTRDEW